MSDTTDRLTRARAEIDVAHAELNAAELAFHKAPGRSDRDAEREALKDFLRATARHSRALRELFLASLEAPVVEPPKQKPATYTADGPAYRRLRAQMVARSMHSAVACIDRLEAFAGDEADVRIVAGLLTQFGERETAASLLRNVEG